MKILGFGLPEVSLLLLLLLLVLVIYLLLIRPFVAVAQDKGCDKTGTVWLLGILGSPFLAGIYAAALPDRGHKGGAASGAAPNKQDINSQLPPI